MKQNSVTDQRAGAWAKWTTCKNPSCRNDDIAARGALTTCLMCSKWVSKTEKVKVKGTYSADSFTKW